MSQSKNSDFDNSNVVAFRPKGQYSSSVGNKKFPPFPYLELLSVLIRHVEYETGISQKAIEMIIKRTAHVDRINQLKEQDAVRAIRLMLDLRHIVKDNPSMDA